MYFNDIWVIFKKCKFLGAENQIIQTLEEKHLLILFGKINDPTAIKKPSYTLIKIMLHYPS